MDDPSGYENYSTTSTDETSEPTRSSNVLASRNKLKNKRNDDEKATKRRCVSSACIACRRRKSKVCSMESVVKLRFPELMNEFSATEIFQAVPPVLPFTTRRVRILPRQSDSLR